MIKPIAIEEHWSIIEFVTLVPCFLGHHAHIPNDGICDMQHKQLPLKKATYGIWYASFVHHVKHEGL